MEVVKQPTRSKRITKERRFDRTQLRAGGHGRTVHRDYGSHFFRWGWVSRQVKAGESILDVGCGQDQPLLYILGSRIQTVPDVYVGVDLNNIPNKSHVKWADVYDNFDFVTHGVEFLEPKYTPFDKAVCFEVIEHMQPPDGRRLLDNVYRLLRQGGLLYLSTPVFNGAAAANHLHEYTIPELREAVEAAGYKVQRRIGTFASKPEIKPVLNPCQTQLYDEMEEWFGGDVMSTIFAYNHPDQSRNNLWVLEKP